MCAWGCDTCVVESDVATISETPILRVRGVTKRIVHEGSEIDILRGIDLDVDAGEMVAIMGASGAGKSTFLHIVGTLDVPSTGSVLFRNEDVTRFDSKRLATFRNETLGFVFQFHHLLPEFNALENVMMPGLIRGMERKALEKRASEGLDEVGLAHRISHRPSELSGGEQQRVALARALILEPKILLADEPTGNLDSQTSKTMHELFVRLNQKRQTTFIVVTHSQELAARMPRVVEMRDGLVVTDSKANNLITKEEPPLPTEATL